MTERGMRPPVQFARFGCMVAVCAALAVTRCSSEPVITQISIQSPLASERGDVVLAVVDAVQGEEHSRVEVGGSGDSATLQLRVGESVTITGTVFVFAENAWYAYSKSQVLMPTAGSTELQLDLDPAPEVQGSLIPTATVSGAAEAVEDDPQQITITDLATQWTTRSPFNTQTPLVFPSGRAISVSIDDHFGGGTASRTLDTTSFVANTPIPVQADATIPIVNDDLPGLLAALGPLADSALGLECSVGGTCADGTFSTCDASVLTLDTESAYTIAIRYAKVPASCVESRVVRDLTAPGLATVFTPAVVQASTTSLTLVIDANEPVRAESTSVTFGSETTNRCTPTAVSATRVRCAIDLTGATLTSDIAVTVKTADLAGNQGVRLARLRTRTGAPIQVVDVRVIPPTLDLSDYQFYLGVTFGVFDKNDLCGFEAASMTSTGASGTSTVYDDGYYGDDNAKADTTADYTLVTFWTRAYSYYVGSEAGSYALSQSFNFNACGSRVATTANFTDEPLELVDEPSRFVGGKIVLSSLPYAGDETAYFPLLGYGEAQSANSSIAECWNGDGFHLAGIRTGTTQCLAYDVDYDTGERTLASSIDIEVGRSTELLAIQDESLVRRADASDVTLPLPSSIGTGLRVFWESTRSLAVAVGAQGVALYHADGTVTSLVAPCDAETIRDATLTAPYAGVSGAADLVLLVDDGAGETVHCEIDLSAEAVAASASLTVPACTTPSRIGVDAISNTFFVAGDGCAATYERTGLDTIVVRDTTQGMGGEIPVQLVVSGRSALAALMTDSNVYSFDLTGGLTPHRFDTTPNASNYNFAPTAIAIEPVTGAVWVAGLGYNYQAGLQATLYEGFADRHGASHYVEQLRTDPNSLVAPTVLSFDSASHRFYSSRPEARPAVASLVTFDTEHLDVSLYSYYDDDISDDDAPIRAWPNGADVYDVAVVGPTPYGFAHGLAAVPGQRVDIIGSGFAGGGRDEVFVEGTAAKVVASTSTTISFVVPPSISRLLEHFQYAPNVHVLVRSNGLLSGFVPAQGVPYGYDVYYKSTFQLGTATPAFVSYANGSGSTCPSSCSTPVSTLDLGGAYGLMATRPNDYYFGLARSSPEVGGSATAYAASGMSAPLLVPATRRLVGVKSGALVDQFLDAFTWGPSHEAVTAQRTRAASVVSINALYATADGRQIVAGTSTGFAFYWASTLLPHPIGSVATTARDFATLSGSGTMITASAAGELAAFRVSGASIAPVAVTTNSAGCPSGARTGVLALVGDAYASDSSVETVLALTTYANGFIAAEEIVTDASGTHAQCRSAGRSNAGAIKAGALDPTGLRAVIADSNATLRVFDTRDLTQTRYVDTTISGVTQLVFGVRGGFVVALNGSTYSLHNISDL